MFRFSYSIPLVALCLSSTGCVIELVDGKTGDTDFSTGSSGWDTSSSSGYDTGAGGANSGSTGSMSGSTGSMTGSGGGGTTTTTTGGGSGTGGGAACVGAAGNHVDSSVCDHMAISVSCGGQSSIGWASCKHGFDIFERGQAEDLASCLAAIPASQACDNDPVAKCVDRMYSDACVDPGVGSICVEWHDVCAKSGEALDAGRCAADLNPFNESAIGAMADCMNATKGNCQQRYDACYEKAFSL